MQTPAFRKPEFALVNLGLRPVNLGLHTANLGLLIIRRPGMMKILSVHKMLQTFI